MTGLGLNTGIGDAHNLTWKLAEVLKSNVAPSLLETYEIERRPVGQRIADWALFAFMNLRVLDSGSGLIPGAQSLPVNKVIYEKLTAKSYEGEVRRAALNHAIQSQAIETNARDLELGSVYPEGLLVPDGSERPKPDPRGREHHPNARPGHRLPHAWLSGPERVSTFHFLEGSGNWVLFTDAGITDNEWKERVSALVKRSGLDVKIVRIGDKGDFADETGQWIQDSGLTKGKGGAVLVRPDHYVAFRAIEHSKSSAAQFDKLVKFLAG